MLDVRCNIKYDSQSIVLYRHATTCDKRICKSVSEMLCLAKNMRTFLSSQPNWLLCWLGVIHIYHIHRSASLKESE